MTNKPNPQNTSPSKPASMDRNPRARPVQKARRSAAATPSNTVSPPLQNVVISIEDQPAFLLHRDGVRSAFNPQNYVEFELVDKLASISWRQSASSPSRRPSSTPNLIPGRRSETLLPIRSRRVLRPSPLAWQASPEFPTNAPVPMSPTSTRTPRVRSTSTAWNWSRYQVALDRQYRNALLNLRQYRKDFAGSATTTTVQLPEAEPIVEPVAIPPKQ